MRGSIVLRWWGHALCWLLALFLCPLFWLLVALLLLYRLLAFLVTGVRVSNVMGMDAVFAQDQLGPGGLIASMGWLDAVPDVAAAADLLASRVLLATRRDGSGLRFPKFSQRLEFRWGFAVWRHVPRINVRQHVYEHGAEAGGQEELEAMVNVLLNRHVDPSRPGWELIVIRLKDGWRDAHYPGETVPRAVLLFRCHHSYADGVSLVRILAEILASNGQQLMGALRSRVGDVRAMRKELKRRMLWARATLVLTGLVLVPYYYLQLTVQRDVGPLRQRGMRTGTKHFCWSPPLPLAKIKLAKRAVSSSFRLNVTVNDVIMSCVAGAVRRYLLDRRGASGVAGCLVPDRLKAFLPVNVEPLDRPVSDSNKLVVLLAQLATGVTDPLARVLASKRMSDELKSSGVQWMMNDLTSRVAGFFPRCLILANQHLWSPSLVYSNVPGPPVPVELLGCRMVSAFSFVPHGLSMGLTVAFMSYCDHVVVCVTLDDGGGERTVAQSIVRAVEEELELLVERLAAPDAKPSIVVMASDAQI